MLDSLRPGLLLLVLGLVLGTPALAGPPAWTVQSLDGTSLEATSFVPGGKADLELVLVDGRKVTRGLRELVRLERISEAGEVPPTTEILLFTGDRVLGSITGGDETGLWIESSLLGEVFLGVDTIVQVIFHKNRRPGDIAAFPLRDETDTAYRRTVSGRDAVTGVLLGFDGTGATFDSAIGEFRMDYSDLLAISLLPQMEPRTTEELLLVIDGADGTHVEGLLVSIAEGQLVLSSRTGEKRRVDLGATTSITFKNGAFAHLSDLDPVGVEQVPLIGDPEDFLFPFRKDLSVGGQPLRIAGKAYRRGLGVHSRCELTYAIQGRYRTFQASIGIDDEALGLPVPGAAVFAVSVDGREIYRSPLLRAGQPAVRLGPLDLGGGDELVLLVDFGDDRTFGDRADWAEALLVE
jgi:hypothetical protein